MSDPMYKRIGFICRVQPPHKGHFKVIRDALSKCRELVIMVGSANSPRTPTNPFTYQERVNMIMGGLNAMELGRVRFEPLPDDVYNMPRWVAAVQERMSRGLADAVNDNIAIISSNKGNDDELRQEWLPFWDHLTTPAEVDMNATDVRARIFTNTLDREYTNRVLHENTLKQIEDIMSTEDFKNVVEFWQSAESYKRPYLEAIEAGTIPYMPIWHTVDNVVICAGHILLVQRGKHPGKGLWAIPGGFLELNETNLEGAIRELKEETNLDIPPRVLETSVISSDTFDHPSRSHLGRMVTNAFCYMLSPQLQFDNKPVRNKGGLPIIRRDFSNADEVLDIRWVPLAEFYAMENQMFDDHYHIVRSFVDGSKTFF